MYVFIPPLSFNAVIFAVAGKREHWLKKTVFVKWKKKENGFNL